MTILSDIAALLRAPVGNNLENRPQDVKNLKRNFANEGRYKRSVENGYHDQERMIPSLHFNAITA